MGRGPVVQARKNAVNAQKGKIFSMHQKLIALAAQKGGNPEDNPSLASAISKAKKDGVPNDNIERAIKKGTGEDSDANTLQEIYYEGYAPGGVALIVKTITDNKNRTVANIRNIFSKYGGNLGESGAVSWMFHKKGVIFIDTKVHSYSDIESILYEIPGLEDIINENLYIKVITNLEDFENSLVYLENTNISIMESKTDFIPDNEIEVSDFDNALKIVKMLEAFNEDDDVELVSSNEIISAELSQKVEAFIEENTFRT